MKTTYWQQRSTKSSHLTSRMKVRALHPQCVNTTITTGARFRPPFFFIGQYVNLLPPVKRSQFFDYMKEMRINDSFAIEYKVSEVMCILSLPSHSSVCTEESRTYQSAISPLSVTIFVSTTGEALDHPFPCD